MRAQRLLPILLIYLILSTLRPAAQQTDGSAGAGPRLAGIVDLSSLALLWDDSGDPAGGRPEAAAEPLDIASTATGPVLLFSDRVLSLGINLEMTTRTVQDITVPRLPEGMVPSRLLLNPLCEPVIYDAETGSLQLLHRDGSSPERLETGFAQALEAASLRGGGVALSDGKRLIIFTRRSNELARREITLPVAFTTGLSIDDEDRLWVYDLAARKARAFDLSGQELLAVTPDISGGTLLFPQVFRARADGGFFLGTAGELWCFEADGSVRWRLTQFSAGFRQSLPAFYRLAAGKETDSSFYILDPLGNRILKFTEDPGNTEEKGLTLDGTLAAALQSSESLQTRQNEIVRLCLERELYLQAAFFRRSRGDEPVVTDLAERLRAKQARLLAELAVQLENELRFPEAEVIYNRALSLYRGLRSLDPVDPRYPEAVRQLGEQRNKLRQIRVAANLLTAEVEGNGSVLESDKRELGIALTNTSGSSITQVELLAGFYGYPESLWQGTLEKIPAGGQVLLTVPISKSSAGMRGASTELNGEDLYVPCNLLVRYVYNRENAAEHFRLPLVFPAGTLQLPACK